MILNSTNCRILEKLYKTAYIERWIGRQFEVGVESVRVASNYEDALRIRKYLPKAAGAPKCSDCGEEVASTDKMNVAQIVAVTQKRFGKCLCAKCWMESISKPSEPEDKPAETETENDSE